MTILGYVPYKNHGVIYTHREVSYLAMNQYLVCIDVHVAKDADIVGLILVECVPEHLGIRCNIHETSPSPDAISDASFVPLPNRLANDFIEVGLPVPAPKGKYKILKWVFYSNTGLETTEITYSISRGDTTSSKSEVYFYGYVEFIYRNGTIEHRVVAGDVKVLLEIGLPGPWDDDGIVTDTELLLVIAAWVNGRLDDIVLLKYIATWANITSQSSQGSGVQPEFQEESPAIELDGAVIAYGDTINGHMNVTFIEFCIKLSVGKHPVDLSNDTLTIAYTDPYLHVYNIYNGYVTDDEKFFRSKFQGASYDEDPGHWICGIYEVRGDGDTMLEYGEKFLVRIDLLALYKAYGNYETSDGQPYTKIQPNDEFIIEVKPPVGATLTVIRRLPLAFDNVMNLG